MKNPHNSQKQKCVYISVFILLYTFTTVCNFYIYKVL